MSKPYLRPGNDKISTPNTGNNKPSTGHLNNINGPTPNSINENKPNQTPNMNDNIGYGSANSSAPHTPNMNDNMNYGNVAGGAVNNKGDRSPAKAGPDALNQKDGLDNESSAGLNNGHNEPRNKRHRHGALKKAGEIAGRHYAKQLAKAFKKGMQGKGGKGEGKGGNGQGKGKGSDSGKGKGGKGLKRGWKSIKGLGFIGKYMLMLKIGTLGLIKLGDFIQDLLPFRVLNWMRGAGHAIGGGMKSMWGGLTSHLGLHGGHMLAAMSPVTKSVIGIGLTATIIGGFHEYHDLTKDGGYVACEVEQIASGSAGSGSVSGTDGAWTKKGSKAYNEAKATYAAAKAQGCDDKHAAAVAGNAAHESAMFSHGLDVHQFGGGPGVGIFQFNDPPKDMSPSGQVKAIFANAPGRKGGWEHSSGSIPSLTNSFEEIFERGGIPDNGLRDKLANRAYQMFNGVGGSAADETDSAASGAAGASCGSQDSSGTDTSNIIAFAKKFLHHIPYTNAAGDRQAAAGKMKDGHANGASTDCSGFVWAVLKDLGYKTPSSCWSTANMLTSDGGTLKKIPASETKAGDVVIVGAGHGGDSCHTAFLEEKWHGNNTKIIDEGGDGSDVNESTFKDAFLSIIGTYPTVFGEPQK